jgi:dimethylglycine dehydrogenase
MAERFHQRFFRAVPLPAGTVLKAADRGDVRLQRRRPQIARHPATPDQHRSVERGFPLHAIATHHVAGVDVVALRVSFTGDLGWELHCAKPIRSGSTPRCSGQAANWAPARSAHAR